MSKQLTPGEVITIRVRPEDIMTSIDIIDRVGMYQDGMSISSAVKWALAHLCELARQNKLAPVRDGFEYSQMLSRFERGSKADRAKRTAIGVGLTNYERTLAATDQRLSTDALVRPDWQPPRNLVIPLNQLREISARLIDPTLAEQRDNLDDAQLVAFYINSDAREELAKRLPHRYQSVRAAALALCPDLPQSEN